MSATTNSQIKAHHPPPREEVRGRGPPCSRGPDFPLRRHRPRSLIIENLRPPLALLCRQLGLILRQLRAHRHAALHPGPRAKFLEPALEVLELLDVLTLRLPVR